MSWDTLIAFTFISILTGLITWAILLALDVKISIKRLFKPKPKYRIGQKVRVRGDLLYGEKYNKRTMYLSMMKHVGSVVTIEFIDEDQHIYIDEDDEDTWSVEMFEPLIITKEHAFEALLHGHISDEEYTVIMKKRGRRG